MHEITMSGLLIPLATMMIDQRSQGTSRLSNRLKNVLALELRKEVIQLKSDILLIP